MKRRGFPGPSRVRHISSAPALLVFADPGSVMPLVVVPPGPLSRRQSNRRTSVHLCACAGPATPMAEASAEAPTPIASGMPIMLCTHCGIEEVRVDDTVFIAETPLNDGQGNPPTGWGTPIRQAP